MLAELDLEYRVIPVDITAGEQFLRPEDQSNNRCRPSWITMARTTSHAVFESAVVLIYLAENQENSFLRILKNATIR
jgi:GST-like protein